MSKNNKSKKKRLTFRFVWETYLKPSNIDSKCTEKHMAETERHLDRWESFWKLKTTELKNPKLPGVERIHLETWRRYLLDQGKLSARSINKHLGSIRAIMVAADKNGLLKRRPKLEQLPAITTDIARKIYLKDEQIDALMETADKLQWPPQSITGIPACDWWRCAMVMYRTYGFRTQELLAYEHHKQPITWDNISLSKESPNPVSDMQNEHGWLHYTPPKTIKKKPTPIYLPLTRFARAAIDRLRTVNQQGQLFLMPRSQEAFLAEWYRWFDLAKIYPKIPGAKYRPYCMRKTCATHLSQYFRGLATAVCRWGSDGDEAKVALEHYISDDMLLQKLLTAPMPATFAMLIKDDGPSLALAV